jgi:ribosomal protein L35AE/L33A
MTSILEIEALLGKAVMYTYSYYGRKYRGIVTGDIDGEN